MTALLVLYDSIVRIGISSYTSSSSSSEKKKEGEEEQQEETTSSPDDGSHVLTDLLNDGVMRTPQGVSLGKPSEKKEDDKVVFGKGFGIELKSFDGYSLQELTSKMLIATPSLARLRMNLLKYVVFSSVRACV